MTRERQDARPPYDPSQSSDSRTVASSQDARPVPAIRSQQDLQNRGLDRVIVEAFYDPQTAGVLLVNAGVPRTRVPQTEHTERFWQDAFHLFETGVTPGGTQAGFTALLTECARLFPGNPHFRPWNPDQPTPDTPSSADQPSPEANASHEPETSGVGIVIRYYNGHVADAYDRAVELARTRGIPLPVEIALANEAQISLFLPNADPATASQLVAELQGLQEGIEVQTLRPGLRDYFFQRLYGEGPDGRRFEYENVPASTRVSEIGAATAGAYGDEGWGRDQDNLPSPAVVDHIRGEGGERQEQRLDGDHDLDQAGVGEGDTLQTSPERTAASVNPNVREQALARARAQIQRFVKAHPKLKMRLFSNATVAPTVYVLEFTTPGWAPPLEKESQPEPIDRHSVLIEMSPQFPMQAPVVAWRTPVFHPNISPRDRIVCLGALMKGYVPGMDLGQLCQLLVDIASYKNYEPRSVLDVEAREWLRTEEGKRLIAERGGKTVEDIIRAIERVAQAGRPAGFRIRQVSGTAERNAPEQSDE